MEVKLSRFYQDSLDRVSFVGLREDGTRCDRPQGVCYMGVLHDPGDWEIRCSPAHSRNSTPKVAFRRFFKELIRYGLVPEEVKITTRKNINSIVVPRKGWGYHPVFITLSLYRHSDCHGKSILGRTLRLYDQLRKEGTHFLQCLHWALANTRHSLWHSCFSIAGVGTYGGNETINLNLKYGVALRIYGQLSLSEKNQLPKSNSSIMFSNSVADYQDLKVKNLDQILNPKYAQYYENPKLLEG